MGKNSNKHFTECVQMANEHVKKCSAYKSQENAILKVKSPEKPNACEDIKQHKMSNIASGSIKWYTHFGEEFVSF